MRPRLAGLWRHPDFLKLWAGQTVSLLGSQVTLLALPLAAVLTLHARPAQMGLLTACGTAPGVVVGLFAGVWVDHHRRRSILIWTNVARGAILLAIPAASLLGVLRIELLYAVALGTSLFAVFFSVAYQAFLPSLISHQDLVDGNSKLQFSLSVARVGGPGLAGALVQAITAPIAIVVDAVSFFVAGLTVLLIRRPEAAPLHVEERRKIGREIGEGLRAVWSDPLLRSMGMWAGTFNLFGTMIGAVILLFLTRDLQIKPSLLGLIFAAGSLGGVVSALLAGRITRRFGLGRTLAGSAVLAAAPYLLLPLAAGPTRIVVPLVIGVQLAFSIAAFIVQINVASLQQAITPNALLGRVNATMFFLTACLVPVGSLIGGLLGELVGVRATVAIGATGVTFASLLVVFSPLRSLREQPAPVEQSPQRSVELEPV